MMSWLDRWKNRSRPMVEPAVPVAEAVQIAVPEQLDIDLSAGLGHEFPDEYPVAASTAQAVIALLGSADLAPLAKRSPSLAGYDWANYLRCSQCRVVRALRALKQHVPNDGRVLDYGSYFGNFSTAAAAMGYRVDAIDCVSILWRRARAVGEHAAHSWCCAILDFADTGHDFAAAAGNYDAVICAGVLEHIPHTPRQLLEGITRLLAPRGAANPRARPTLPTSISGWR